MLQQADSWQEQAAATTQHYPGVFIAMGPMEEELAKCQPTPRDFSQTLMVIESRSQAIWDNPRNAAAYSDRALALAFLGRDQESRQDQEQAERLGLDGQVVAEEIALIREVAIGYSDSPESFANGPSWTNRAKWLSAISSFPSLLGLGR